MRSRTLHHAIGCLAVFTASAWTYSCSDEDPRPSEAVVGNFRSLSLAICSTAMRCCNRGEISLMMGPYVDSENCTDRYTDRARFNYVESLDAPDLGMPRIALPNLGAVKEAADGGRVRLDGAALQACREYLDVLPCNELLPEEEQADGCELPEPPVETPCDPDKLFIGLVPEGGQCTSPGASLECQPGLVCLGNPLLGIIGECVRPGRVGEPCFGESSCEAELYCSQLDGTCQPSRLEGETCVFADREDPLPPPETLLVRCAAGLSCDPITDTCVAPCQRGAACINDEACDEDLELKCIVGRCDRPRVAGLPCAVVADCAEGLRCAVDPEDAESKICQERLGNGETCAAHDECASEFCDPALLTCAAQVPPTSACPSGVDAQCRQGSCEPELVSCVTDADCPLSDECNLATNVCSGYCVALKPTGAICVLDTDCDSNTCVVGFCRELPLLAGQACDEHEQCESTFCNYEDDRVCAKLPLALGQRCQADAECGSQVCFGAAAATFDTCINGLDEGEACGQPTQAKCNPSKFYCDAEATPVACAPLHEAGEDCETSAQCRGDCIIRFGRKMCDATVDPTKFAICDGSEPLLAPAAEAVSQ